MKDVISESVILKECLSYLQMKGFYCWRNNTGAVSNGQRFIRFGFVGSSDILGILPDGRFLAVECKKSKGGIVSEKQKEFLFNIEKNNGVAFVVNSLESLLSQLKEKKII